MSDHTAPDPDEGLDNVLNAVAKVVDATVDGDLGDYVAALFLLGITVADMARKAAQDRQMPTARTPLAGAVRITPSCRYCNNATPLGQLALVHSRDCPDCGQADAHGCTVLIGVCRDCVRTLDLEWVPMTELVAAQADHRWPPDYRPASDA